LDEVGRGTSTADGLAIARATTEFIHDELGATTLFATHYHGLTALADEREGIVNRHFAATREGEEITFLHRVAPGASSASYGIEVARMAGVPESVVDRARSVVETDASNAGTEDATGNSSETAPSKADTPADPRPEPTDDPDTPNEAVSEQPESVDDRASYPEEAFEVDDADDRASYPDDGFFEGTPDPAIDEPLDEESMVRVAVALRALDVASMTPLEALNTLDELRSELR
ncbi:MAG: DNA mismatch repair protein MutS, partial [Halohasta sp.]